MGTAVTGRLFEIVHFTNKNHWVVRTNTIFRQKKCNVITYFRRKKCTLITFFRRKKCILIYMLWGISVTTPIASQSPLSSRGFRTMILTLPTLPTLLTTTTDCDSNRITTKCPTAKHTTSIYGLVYQLLGLNLIIKKLPLTTKHKGLRGRAV